jgi:hypothetical protein
MSTRSWHAVGGAILAVATAALLPAQSIPAIYTSPTEFRDTFFILPNADPPVAAPMVRAFLSAGTGAFGGGQYTKAGFAVDFNYLRFTEGVGFTPSYGASIWGGPSDGFTTYLPPDRSSLSQLPLLAKAGYDGQYGTADDLDRPHSPWTVSRAPRVIAALEWARYTNTPVGFQLQLTGPQGGQNLGGAADALDVDGSIEKLTFTVGNHVYSARFQCAMDASNYVDVDNDPTTPDPAGDNNLVRATFATPTMADPATVDEVFGAGASAAMKYMTIIETNMKDVMAQLNSLSPAYPGLVAAIAIDPEIHMPANIVTGAQPSMLPNHPSYGSPSSVARAMFADYHPAIIREFQKYLEQRYGDSAPNSDSNGDGRTFWADFGSEYQTSGWPGLANVLAGTPGFVNMPADPAHPYAAGSGGMNQWNLIDPPRNFPTSTSTVLSPFWHEWTNFKTRVVKRFVDNLVRWAVEGGCPSDRIFTHQTDGSSTFIKERAVDYFQHPLHWADDLTHLETSFGRPGLSHYTAGGLTTGWSIYQHLFRMDDDWGSPEFNPTIESPTADLTQVMNDTWDYKGHVIWAHSWNDSVPAYNCFDGSTHSFVAPASTGIFPNWIPVKLQAQTGPTGIHGWTSGSTGDGYFESPTLSISASSFTHVILTARAFFNVPPPSLIGKLKIHFQKAGSTTWYPVGVDGLLHHDTVATGDYVVDMTDGLGAASDWNGTITKLRIYATPLAGDYIHIEKLQIAGPSAFTTAMKQLMGAKSAVARPADVAPISATLPFDFRTQIAALYNAAGTGNFVYYGSDPLPGTTDNFSDFGYAGNFQATNRSVGGVPMASIGADVPTYLGRRATGKFRKLVIPDVADLYLSFSIGVADGTVPSGTDGVGFRIVVRDGNREQIVLFEDETDGGQWERRQSISLNAFRGQTIDIAFETYGLAKAGNELALWGEPRIEQRFQVSTAVAGTGSGTFSPVITSPQRYAAGSTISFTAASNPGSAFSGWTTSGSTSDLSSTSNPSMTLTVNGPHVITANFALQTTTIVYGRGNEDGYILESPTTPDTGGTKNDTDTSNAALRVGDDAGAEQWKSIVSFNRSDFAPAIPSTAVIDSVRIRLKRGAMVGTTSGFGVVQGGLVLGNFGVDARVAVNDWQNAPSGLVFPAFSVDPSIVDIQSHMWALLVSSTYDEILAAASGSPSIIQIRIQFSVTDDGDAADDYVGFWSGESAATTDRPMLEIIWH